MENPNKVDGIQMPDTYQENKQIFRNWADVETCKPKYYHEPGSVNEIKSIVNYAKMYNQRIRVIGSGHSPSNISFLLLCLRNMLSFNLNIIFFLNSNLLHRIL